MLLVKIIKQFLRIPEILRRFPASRYGTVARPLYETMELPVAPLRVEDPVGFPYVRVIDYCRLWFSWRLAGDMRWIAVEQRDVENVVLPDRVRKV